MLQTTLFRSVRRVKPQVPASTGSSVLELQVEMHFFLTTHLVLLSLALQKKNYSTDSKFFSAVSLIPHTFLVRASLSVKK